MKKTDRLKEQLQDKIVTMDELDITMEDIGYNPVEIDNNENNVIKYTNGKSFLNIYVIRDEQEYMVTVVIPTGICCEMNPDCTLFILPRSGLGFEYQLGISNTLGLIDSDYFYSDNEGHIMIKLVNRGDKEINIPAGKGFAQGVFMQYGITVDDDCDGVRNGGFGSTTE